MELVRGKAAKVRHTLQMGRGAGDRHSNVSTTHICLLQLQERTVSLHARHPLIVNEGDQLVVAGRNDRQGLLRGFAHANLSTGTRGDDGLWQHIIAAPVCLAAAGFIWGAMAGVSINGVPLHWLPSLLLAGVGIYFAVRGAQVWQAVQRVGQESAR